MPAKRRTAYTSGSSRKRTRPTAPPVEPGSPTTGQAGQDAIVNLEMRGDRPKIYSLQTLLTNKKNPGTRSTARLGDVLLPWYEKVVAGPGQKLEKAAELWQALVPGKLCLRSRLVSLHRGTLTVALDSSTVRAEIDALLRGGILRQLQGQSRGTIFRVKTCVDVLREGDG